MVVTVTALGVAYLLSMVAAARAALGMGDGLVTIIVLISVLVSAMAALVLIPITVSFIVADYRKERDATNVLDA